jgi:putative DNA primase/helicase
VELAKEFLPPTPLRFGRKGKPDSHWLYRAASATETKKHALTNRKMIVEVRSTGAQTVFPGSRHPSGEAIEWIDPDAEPAEIDPATLHEAVARLADEVRRRLGETKPKTLPRPKRNPVSDANGVPMDKRLERWRKYAEKIPDAISGSGGHSPTLQAACECFRLDLDNSTTWEAMSWWNTHKCQPAWTEKELAHKIEDAEKKAGHERGIRLPAAARSAAPSSDAPSDNGEPELIELGQRDPKTGKLVLSTKRTLPTAEAYVTQFHDHAGGRTLHHYAANLLAWERNRYCHVEDGAAKQRLQSWLHDSLRYIPLKDGSMELVPFDANPATVNSALESIKAYTHLPASISPPAWLDGRDGPDPRELLPTPSGTLHVPTEKMLAPTPALFNTNAIDFDFDPNPEPPERFIKFIEQLWEDDIESVQTLQEIIGYLLVADTSQQKMFLIVGPKRSGKGTLGRLITKLVGAANVVGPTTSSLAGPFGLQPLLGKSVAIVSDARFTGDNVAVVVERLLCISGEDTLSVDQKFMPSITAKLGTRFVFLSNELPRMNDASGALAGRFVILRLVRSFYGMEDVGLTTALAEELPGILVWAIEGLNRLRARGHFVQPASVADAIREMEDLSSPIGAFVREMCVVAKGRMIAVRELFAAWKLWCEGQGRDHAGTLPTFGRDLRAAAAGIGIDQRTVGGERIRVYEGIDLQSTAKELVMAAKIAESTQSRGGYDNRY